MLGVQNQRIYLNSIGHKPYYKLSKYISGIVTETILHEDLKISPVDSQMRENHEWVDRRLSGPETDYSQGQGCCVVVAMPL